MKIGYVLSQVKFYSHWDYRNVNKHNWISLAILFNKLSETSSMCYSIIINHFKSRGFEKLKAFFLLI